VEVGVATDVAEQVERVLPSLGKRHFLEEGAVASQELAGRDETYRRRLLARLEEDQA